LSTVLKVNDRSAQYIVAIALLLAMPLFVFMGALSDRIGRKWIMMSGCLLAAVSYLPIYQAMQRAAGSNVVTATSRPEGLVPQTQINGQLEAAKEVLPYVDLSTLLSSTVAWKLILLVFIQVFFVTMVYGPIAAYLVEAFPAKIRYTSLSLPYHIGNGVFGGLLPVIGLTAVRSTGNIIASLTFIVGSLLLKETKHTLIWDEVSHR
jgi:MFS family permease